MEPCFAISNNPKLNFTRRTNLWDRGRCSDSHYNAGRNKCGKLPSEILDRLSPSGFVWLSFHLGVNTCSINSFAKLDTSIHLLALATFSAICFFFGLKLIPEINAARDADQNDKFKKLHLLDVILVGLAQLAIIATIVVAVTF